jgi:tripartite-type tricarboxylate transporter receptor subunit TctC
MNALVTRRELLLGLAALPSALSLASRTALAETYPTRPVRILVATSAGGGTDLVARFIAQWLTERLGQSFVVENRPGGGNNIGTEMAARAPADGYTLFMANTVNAINNSLYQKLNYNFIADFAPVANVMGTPLLVLVHPSVKAQNAAELIALAKASPGKLNLASGGIGSTGHMSAELFQMMAGIKFTHVPYRGEAPALTDLIAGQAQVMVSTTGSSLQYAKAGTLRALATTTDDRVAELPGLQPLSQTVPGYQANGWNGLCAPKATPAAIITLLNKEVNLAMADPKIKERMASLGGVALPGSPEDYGRTIAADTEKWGKVVQFSGAQVN